MSSNLINFKIVKRGKLELKSMFPSVRINKSRSLFKNVPDMLGQKDNGSVNADVKALRSVLEDFDDGMENFVTTKPRNEAEVEFLNKELEDLRKDLLRLNIFHKGSQETAEIEMRGVKVDLSRADYVKGLLAQLPDKITMETEIITSGFCRWWLLASNNVAFNACGFKGSVITSVSRVLKTYKTVADRERDSMRMNETRLVANKVSTLQKTVNAIDLVLAGRGSEVGKLFGKAKGARGVTQNSQAYGKAFRYTRWFHPETVTDLLAKIRSGSFALKQGARLEKIQALVKRCEHKNGHTVSFQSDGKIQKDDGTEVNRKADGVWSDYLIKDITDIKDHLEKHPVLIQDLVTNLSAMAKDATWMPAGHIAPQKRMKADAINKVAVDIPNKGIETALKIISGKSTGDLQETLMGVVSDHNDEIALLKAENEDLKTLVAERTCYVGFNKDGSPKGRPLVQEDWNSKIEEIKKLKIKKNSSRSKKSG